MNDNHPRSKNKWNSQRISKRFKNRHLNDEHRDKSMWKPINVNSYIKNWQEDSTETNVNEPTQPPSSWTCEQCTFCNIESYSYCAICEFPFNANETVHTNYNAQCDMTMAHYLNPILSQIQSKHDEFDEQLQLAIEQSLQSASDSDDSTDSTKTHHTLPSVPHKNKKRKRKAQRISFATYWQELNEYNALLQKNIKYIIKQNKRRMEQDKDQTTTPWPGHGQMNASAYTLLQGCPVLMSAVPCINTIYSWLGKQWDVKEFKIQNVINYHVLYKFVRHGRVSKGQLQIVYHGTRARHNESIISKGLVVGGTKGVAILNGAAYGYGVYCSPHLSTARGYERGSLFICLVRSHKCKKSGTIYVVPNDDDILPIYLASFSYSDLVANNSIFKFQPGWKPLNVDVKAKKERKLKRKWSAYHKLLN
eukprot:484581_1